MEYPEIISPNTRSKKTRSWAGAYIQFLRSSQESRVLKMMPLVLAGVIPLSVADDFILPIVGLIDDIPTTLLTIIVIVITAVRVRKYR